MKQLVRVLFILLGLQAASASAGADDRCSPFIENQYSAYYTCLKVCAAENMQWTGAWANDSFHPPVKACIDAGKGWSVCACVIPPPPPAKVICMSGEICKEFDVFMEYNDAGTPENEVCEPWLRVASCARGIPADALAAYEVVFRGNKAYYKTTNTLVDTWTRRGDMETLYVIDARDRKIYMVNVDGRFIQVRGTANCLDTAIEQGGSTRSCSRPRLTTHAGILMGSIAGLPRPNTPPGKGTVTGTVKVLGAGTIRVEAGVIKWITNDSGHFMPDEQALKNTMAFFMSAGFNDFPPARDCPFSFQNVRDSSGMPKTGVYRQDAITDHCHL